jgi:hypothetical protein
MLDILVEGQSYLVNLKNKYLETKLSAFLPYSEQTVDHFPHIMMTKKKVLFVALAPHHI